MKKIQICMLFVFSLCLTMNIKAQNGSNDEKPEHQRSNYIDLNIGSTDLNGGIQGYGTNAGFPGYWTETISPIHFDIGYRRMYNSNFGFKFDFAYDQAKNDDDSRKFKATYYSLRAQVVANLVNIISSRDKFRKWGVLAHAGLGYTGMTLDDKYVPSGQQYDGTNWDNIINAPAGLTFSYRVGNRWELHFDYTVMFLGKVNTQLDGSRGNHGHIDGNITNLSLGTSINVGKTKLNYDWESDGETQTDLGDDETDYDAALADLMVGMNDLKARVDDLGDQINNAPTQNMELNLLKALFDEELVYAFFDFNDSEPNPSSNQAFIVATKYLNTVPNAKLVLTGYADKIGAEAYNDQLAKQRADRCKAILEELGVDGSRISTRSNGEDTKHNANSEGARQVVRRVQFSLE